MAAAVGLLYQEMPQRLCNSYLLDDQTITGEALVIISAIGGLIWIVCLAIRLHRASEQINPVSGTAHNGRQ